ncbi:MAG: hypothetical protein BWZ10_02851 [candidate division BRC1 bacterium ADurb.BinA364]|nr:MAG: hypothetical protein BWZ10_02851 [candidate division BRC1 bacterium ADurb.BinA364]
MVQARRQLKMKPERLLVLFGVEQPQRDSRSAQLPGQQAGQRKPGEHAAAMAQRNAQKHGVEFPADAPRLAPVRGPVRIAPPQPGAEFARLPPPSPGIRPNPRAARQRFRRQGWGQNQRHRQRNDLGKNDRQRSLAINQLDYIPAVKHGNEYDDVCGGRGEKRGADLAGAFPGGIDGVRRSFVAAKDALQRDYRVVDQQPDSQRQTEHGQQVDRHAKGQHQIEGHENRNRNRQRDNQAGHQIAQKQKQHQRGGQGAVKRRFANLVQHILDVFGKIVENLEVAALGQFGFERIQRFQHVARELNRIGRGFLADCQPHDGRTVKAKHEARIAGRNARLGHILQLDDILRVHRRRAQVFDVREFADRDHA